MFLPGKNPSFNKNRLYERILPAKDKKQLQAFTGLAAFYWRFVPNFSITSVLLYNLLRKDSVWKRDEEEEAAFFTIHIRFFSIVTIVGL